MIEQFILFAHIEYFIFPFKISLNLKFVVTLISVNNKIGQKYLLFRFEQKISIFISISFRILQVINFSSLESFSTQVGIFKSRENQKNRAAIRNLFAKFFTSFYQGNPMNSQIDDINVPNGSLNIEDADYNINELSNISFTNNQVKSILTSFDIHKVASPDNIQVMLFENLSDTH